MDLEKFRAFMDLGRVQGVSVTSAVAILGSLTASAGPDLVDILWLVVISLLAHLGGAALNELWDRKLDSAVVELAQKPLVSGAISPNEAKAFIAFCVPASLILAMAVFGPWALIAMLIATLWMLWYCTSGKRTFIICDVAQSVGYPAYAVFGALAVGLPTTLTMVLVGIVASLNLFAQWCNDLKDSDNDRRFGVPSFAAKAGVTAQEGLSQGHPYFIYGVGIKVAFLFFCTIPIFLWRVPMAFVAIVIGIGWPVQYFTMRNFMGVKSRKRYVKLMVGDLLLSYPAAAAISIMNAGLAGFILLGLFVAGGYLLGSTLQSGAEFKFRRRAPSFGSAPSPKPHPNVRPMPAPIMMTWAGTGPSDPRPVRSRLYCTRPQEPGSTTRGKATFHHQEEVYIVQPIN